MRMEDPEGSSMNTSQRAIAHKSKCMVSPLDAGVLRAAAMTVATSALVILPEIVSPCEASSRKDSSSISVVKPALQWTRNAEQ